LFCLFVFGLFVLFLFCFVLFVWFLEESRWVFLEKDRSHQKK
jgi:hypothetical protein